jgi:hypothetical protein
MNGVLVIRVGNEIRHGCCGVVGRQVDRDAIVGVSVDGKWVISAVHSVLVAAE